VAKKTRPPSSPFAVLKDVQLAPPSPAAPLRPASPKTSAKVSQVKRAAPDVARAQDGNTDPAAQARDYDERMAIKRAYAGVRPINDSATPKTVQPVVRTASEVADQAQRDAEARARLDAFVGQAKRFVVERDGDEVRGRRDDLSPAQAAQLFLRVPAPEQKLDLHGLRGEDAGRQVVAFVRAAQRTGKRVVLIVHGRGQHSAGGVGVLAEVVLETLSRGGAAPVVRAFMSAPQRQGGSGALVVFLTDR
jgi:DNA-nicking Smr family endonuclease